MHKLIVPAFVGLTCVVSLSAQAPSPVASHAPAPLTAESEKELFTRYCVGCHSEKAKAAGVDSSRKLTIDSIDFSDVH